MKTYYARRAAEYEHIYLRPERQADLAALHAAIETACADREVLDVACGTGYFTLSAARRARSVMGIDANDETLAIARSKGIANAQFAMADAYAIPSPSQPYDGALVTFWWSHIPRRRIEEFLRGLHRHLAPGANVLIADNTYVDGNSTPIARLDDDGNTYQIRALENGERHEVLKNFPAREELQAWGERFGADVDVRSLTYFWILRYRVK
jgi:demethylmenaquinone methyltransferase/2-methoxy-6-polyprenyl-1,4-benzoquinol methylase